MRYMKYFPLVCVLLLAGCRKETPDVKNPNFHVKTTWVEAFDAFWNGMNYSYVFWDIDPTDWDMIYDEYRPQFEALGNIGSDGFGEVIDLFSDITSELIDHHYALLLYYPHRSSGYTIISPSAARIRKREYYHHEMDMEVFASTIKENIKKGRITGLVGGRDKLDGREWAAVSYNIDDGVVYIYIESFMITEMAAYFSNKRWLSWKAYRNFFHLVKTVPDLRGIVIDVRGNPGGYVNDMHLLLGRLIAEDHLFGYSRTKSGLGRLDYTPWNPLIVYAASDSYKVTVPIVVLTDLYSTSMAESMAMAVKSLPNGCVVGEPTFGGLGALMGDYAYSYAGTFSNNIFEVYTTTTMSKDRDGNIYEGQGVPPTIEAYFDEEAFAAGTDTQLERALEYIKTGR